MKHTEIKFGVETVTGNRKKKKPGANMRGKVIEC